MSLLVAKGHLHGLFFPGNDGSSSLPGTLTPRQGPAIKAPQAAPAKPPVANRRHEEVEVHKFAQKNHSVSVESYVCGTSTSRRDAKLGHVSF